MKRSAKVMVSLLALGTLTATEAAAAPCTQTAYNYLDFTLHAATSRPAQNACVTKTSAQREAINNWNRANAAATALYKQKGICPDYEAIENRWNPNKKIVTELNARKMVSFTVGSRTNQTPCVNYILFGRSEDGASAP